MIRIRRRHGDETLVLGAITGVGIWFTIGLVHPSATSSLINVFVWGWAIEWTLSRSERPLFVTCALHISSFAFRERGAMVSPLQ